MQNINYENFWQTINQHDYAVVDFWAQWCGPCRLQKPIIETMQREANGQYGVFMINVDESPELSSSLNISSLPTILIFKNGKEHKRLIGYQNRATIQESIFE